MQGGEADEVREAPETLTHSGSAGQGEWWDFVSVSGQALEDSKPGGG